MFRELLRDVLAGVLETLLRHVRSNTSPSQSAGDASPTRESPHGRVPPKPQGKDRACVAAMRSYLNPYIQDFDAAQAHRAALAYQTFAEYFDRLEARYAEASRVEVLTTVEHDFTMSDGRLLHEHQIELVDKTEAFHQQIYAALSAYRGLLLTTLPRSERDRLPKDSVSKLLRYVKERSNSSVLQNHIVHLERSVDFRARFVDHPDQHVVHDWMTFRPLGRTVTVYFAPHFGGATPEQEARLREQLRLQSEHNGFADPWSAYFHPPLACESFYVSPRVDDTFASFEQYVLDALPLLFPPTFTRPSSSGNGADHSSEAA